MVVEVVQQDIAEQHAGERTPGRAAGRGGGHARELCDPDAGGDTHGDGSDDDEETVQLRQRTEHEASPDQEWTSIVTAKSGKSRGTD